MKRRRIIIAAFYLNCFMVNATAETAVIRPGPCASQMTYLLATNSGALIKTTEAGAAAGEHVIVFRPQATTGWASQRLLRRFDLDLGENGVRITNSGGFCTTPTSTPISATAK